MAKKSKRDLAIDATLSELHALHDDPTTPSAREALSRALDSPESLVVARAARIIADADPAADLELLARKLPAVFSRFMDKPEQRDKGCRVKTAVARALTRLRFPAAEAVFTTGIRHIQLEPVFGGREDTAAELRGHCAMGLAVLDDPSAPLAIAELLADPQWPARVAAARALTCVAPDVALPLLRLKILTGDDEPQVTGECLRSLLAIAPAASLAFVGRFLDHADEALAEQAALALGEARIDGALPLLRAAADSPLASRRKVALLAVAMLRGDEPLAFLLETVAAAPDATALAAVTALAIYKHDPALLARLRDALRRRADPAFAAKAEELLRP